MKLTTVITAALVSTVCFSFPALSAPTSAVTVQANLDARVIPTTMPTAPEHWADVTAGNFGYGVTIYDSLCTAHAAKVYFYKDTENYWKVGAYVDGAELSGGSSDTPVGALSEYIHFDPMGSRDGTIPAADITLTLTWANGAAAQTITFSFAALTQLTRAFFVESVAQDGAACETGPHNNFDFDGDGKFDYVYRRTAAGTLVIKKSTTEYTETISRRFGRSGDTMLTGDYSGDGLADLVLFRAARRTWFVCRSEQDWDCTAPVSYSFGGTGDVPFRADHDGDGILDLAVWRPNQRKFCFRHSSDESVVCGSAVGGSWTPLK